MKRLIETRIPLKELNDVARREAGFIRVPKLSNLHPYLARRPTATARILTLASILPENTDIEEFKEAIGFKQVDNVPYKILYLVNPDRDRISSIVKKYANKDPKDITIVDPMAGGGAIPLESLRLGFYTIAVEYNPVAYLILKATLEYPAKYGRKLYEETRKEVEKLLKYIRKELSKYYPDPSVKNCIIARGYRCPRCDGLIPMIYTTRLGKNGPYINIVIDKDNKTFRVEIKDEEVRFDRLRCPYCSTPINKSYALKDWVRRHMELLEIALKGDVDSAKKNIEKLLETHIILVKHTQQGFEPANEEDKEHFIKAYIDLAKDINNLRDVLPNTQIPKENEVFKQIREYGIQYWYQLFNPRQLLLLLKVAKYIRNILYTKNQEFSIATILYLSLGINKLINFNNITTTWDNSTSTIRELVDHYSRTRKVDLGLEYCEIQSLQKSFSWAFEPHVTSIGRTAGGILPVLRLLCEWLKGVGDRVEIYCGDARRLSMILGNRSIDVVNVDPPYLSQHFYSDLMEFFWQFLRIMLKPAFDAGYLFNRDPDRGRVELFIEGWSPYLPVLPRESEIIARKGRDRISDLEGKTIGLIEKFPFTGDWYVLKMWEFFKEANRVLKDDGVLIVWFTHSSPDAWEAIVSSLYAADFSLSKVWTLWTEMVQRRVALLTSAFFTSLALVLRKKVLVDIVSAGSIDPSSLIHDDVIRKTVVNGVVDALKSALDAGASGSEVLVMGVAGGIAGATRIWYSEIDRVDVSRVQKSLNEFFSSSRGVEGYRFIKAASYFKKVLYPVSIYIGSTTILKEHLRKCMFSDREISEILLTDNFTRAYLIFWTATRYSDSRELAYDFIEKVCKILRISHQFLMNYGLIDRVSRGSRRAYKVLYGSECYSRVRNNVGTLVRTTAGLANHILRLIGEQEKDDVSRVVNSIKLSIPISKASTLVALYLLRTSRNDELGLVGLSIYTRDFAEEVLLELYRGGM